MTYHRLLPTWVVLACILGLSGFIYSQNLGTSHITLWDEGIHVNVIRNLADYCCTPQLHRTAAIGQLVGTDYGDWTNNTVWLHKPLLPFYLTAGVYKLLGETLFALRLPGAIFALLTALVLYFIGWRFFSERTGLCAAAIFALNPYTNEMAHGREFSGYCDLTLLFFVTLAFYLVFRWVETRSIASLRWLGVVVGLGYLSKGGFALAPFGVLAVVMVLTGRARDLLLLLQSLLVFIVVIAPERLYWLAHHPVEYKFEQAYQLAHLFTVIEKHAGPWWVYFNVFLPAMILAPLVPLAFFSIGWALVRCRPGEPGFTLAVWALAYLVPLSIAVSKIENFIYSVLPALALLIPHMMETLMKRRRLDVVIALCASSAAAYAIPYLAGSHLYPNRFGDMVLASVFVATRLGLTLLKFESKAVTIGALACATVVLLSYYAGTDIYENTRPFKDTFQQAAFHKTASIGTLAGATVALFSHQAGTDIYKNTPPFLDSSQQAALEQTGSELRSLVDKDALVLSHYPPSERSYLFTMYWSGRDVLDVCPERHVIGIVGEHAPPETVVSRLRDRKDLYLISNASLSAAPKARLAIGNLYLLSEIPFEEWSQAAVAACK